ncbi:MAG TPA: amidohydrolase family protein [Vicinamibacterales bacterium]|nr:amidohydrolase family protein [Vicinamibacterales bacterium]
MRFRFVGLLLLVSLASWAQGPAGTPASLVIRNVTVVDGGRATLSSSLVIRGGTIAAVVPAAGTPAATLTLDGTGLFAIPGLIDAHVHLSGGTWTEAVEQLRRAVDGGVTTVFDLAGDTRVTGHLARASITGEIVAPSIYYCALMAGPAFFTDPRVLDASVGFAPGEAPWAQAVTSDTDMIQAVAAARGSGASAIKIYAALDSAAAHRITEEAHRQHLRVFAHATVFPARPSDLVDAGVDMLAHAAYLVWEGSPARTDYKARARGDFAHVPADGPVIGHLLESMRTRGVALNPTLWIFTDGMPKEAITDERIAWMDAVTKRAAAIGIPIVAGTDELIGDRQRLPTLHRELELLVSGAGLTPAQALTAATRAAARAMGVDRVRGSLAAGHAADIVLLAANPLDDIRNTRRIRDVIKDGRLVFPASGD